MSKIVHLQLPYAASEVNATHPEFGLGEAAVTRRLTVPIVTPQTATFEHEEASLHGLWLDWIRSTHAYEATRMAMDEAMRVGRFAKSYLDFSPFNILPIRGAVREPPLLNPALTRKLWLG